jgi:hypothetical protein
MLPLWWPRTACIYCGRPLRQRRWRFGVRQLLTCPDHDDLPAVDPVLSP